MKHFFIHCCLFIALGVSLSACDEYSNFPKGPKEDVFSIDTIFVPGLDVPTISVHTAVAIGEKLANNEETPQEYYILGIVTGFNKKHEEGMTGTYGNAVFYMRDNATSGVEFEGYQVMNLNGTKFTSLDQMALGDTVVVRSKITRYNNTIETVGKSQACLYWTSNMLAYPEKEVSYFRSTFADGLDGWTQKVITNPGMTDVWKSFTTSKGTTSARAQALDAESKKHAGEVWLISPAIDLRSVQSTNPKLTFLHYYQQGASNIEDFLRIKVSTDGSNWTDVEIPNFSNGRDPSHASSTLDISAYASAQTRVAFAYKSTEEVAPKWDIKEVAISEMKRSR